MKIVKLKAGLGNQMFQYAFAKLLMVKYGVDDVLIDTSYFAHRNFAKYLDNGLNMLSVTYTLANKKDLRKYNVPYNSFEPHHFFHRAVSAFQYIFNKNYYFEKNRDYVDINTILKYSYFDGYWQSWRYIEPIREILLKDFKPKNSLSNLTKSYIEKFRLLNAVFVGIRKGDYTESAKSTSHYGSPSFEYYKEAINIMKSKIANPYFIIFSDDIEWVKTNFNFEKIGIDISRIEFRDGSSVYNNFEEMYVMASCKHAIISNSTFNFWGAWLIENKEKMVVAPKEWFKDGKPIDIVPPDWIQI